MKVLLCHNHYLQAGGEDQVFEDESRMLERRGVQVIRYETHSRDWSELNSLEIARRTFWNGGTYAETRRLIRGERPDVMHCTNTFPVLSPSIYAAAQREDVPIVQSLHNFRPMCANALLLRAGRPCDACVGAVLPWKGLIHRCYRDSFLASAVIAALIGWQRRTRRTRDPVTRYVALSESSRRIFVAAGFPADRLIVKPNFVSPDPGVGSGDGRFMLFAGRLSYEKGVEYVLDAWARMSDPIRLIIIGGGKLEERVRQAAAADARITWLDQRPNAEVMEHLGRATALLVPSICFENCPKAILEAYSRGVPVVGSRLGAMEELIHHERTGLHFEPRNADSLVEQVRRLNADETMRQAMRREARKEFEDQFTEEANFARLIDIYQTSIRASGRNSSEESPDACRV